VPAGGYHSHPTIMVLLHQAPLSPAASSAAESCCFKRR
jgi:hypothetical protein